jgi:D-alanyl-D-alanine carboxypeptidase
VVRRPAPALSDTLSPQQTQAELIRHQEASGQKVAVAVVSLGADSLVFSRHAVEPVTPASNQKLLVTAAAWSCWDDSLVAAVRRKLGRRAFLHTRPRIPLAARNRARRMARSSIAEAEADSLYVVFPEHDSLSGLPGFDLLCRIGKLSDNHAANALMNCLTARRHRSRFDVVRDYLAQNGVWTGGLNVEDGSGRSSRNRTTALTLAQTLVNLWQAENRDVFLRSLSVAGTDGTLKRHDLGLGPRVRAKTGSISGTYSLSGYLFRPDDTLAFSIVLNRCYDKRSAFEFFAGLLGTL